MENPSAIYTKHSFLHASRNDRFVQYRLAMAICAITAHGEVKMAQQLKGLWKIYVRTEDARRSLLKSGVRFNNRNVPLFDYDPFSRRSTPSEKIVIRDLPMEVDDDVILQYFTENHPHVHVRSKIMAANILDPNNKPTAFLNGDRYVYVESGFDPVLPKEDMIDDVQCRIWHPSQELKCKRCFDHGHRAHEVQQCPAYVEWTMPEYSGRTVMFSAISTSVLCFVR